MENKGKTHGTRKVAPKHVKIKIAVGQPQPATSPYWGMSSSPLLTPWPWTEKPSRWLMSCLDLDCLVSPFLPRPFFPASWNSLESAWPPGVRAVAGVVRSSS